MPAGTIRRRAEREVRQSRRRATDRPNQTPVSWPSPEPTVLWLPAAAWGLLAQQGGLWPSWAGRLSAASSCGVSQPAARSAACLAADSRAARDWDGGGRVRRRHRAPGALVRDVQPAWAQPAAGHPVVAGRGRGCRSVVQVAADAAAVAALAGPDRRVGLGCQVAWRIDGSPLGAPGDRRQQRHLIAVVHRGVRRRR